MSRVLKRPMFSLGGSTSAGITSGLSRRGYAEAGSVDWGEVDVISEQMKKRYGAVPRQGYNVYDFLTEWGLNMASSPPMGNVIQTAAGTAREPYSKMVEGKGKDEMAQYMANMASTDKALSAFTDIKVAQTEAAANMELKNLPLRREILKNAQAYQATKRQGEFGYELGEAMGVSTGNSLIAKEIEAAGGSVNMGNATRTYDDEGKLKPIDVTILDPAKIWWDPVKYQWFTVKQTGEGIGKAVFHNSKEEAFSVLDSIKTTDITSQLPDHLKVPKEEKKEESFFKYMFPGADTPGVTKDEMDIYAVESLKKTKKDIKEEDTPGYKINQKEKTDNEVYKWWKDNEPNLSYGYQGWPGVN